jgi:hypothetical protein
MGVLNALQGFPGARIKASTFIVMAESRRGTDERKRIMEEVGDIHNEVID